MRARLAPAAVAALIAALTATVIGAAPATAEVPTDFTLDTVPALTQSPAEVGVTLRTDQRGNYSLLWELQDQQGQGVANNGAGPLTGTVPDDGVIAAPFSLRGTDYPDGDYSLLVHLSIRESLSGPALPTSVRSQPVHVDSTGPNVTLKSSTAKIYPLAGVTGYPAATTLTASGATTDIATWQVFNGSGVVRTFTGPGPVVWNGRDTGGTVRPGTFGVRTLDALGNVRTSPVTVTVSAATVVTRTATFRVSPARYVVDRYVGRCSTLRKPALRGWAGSLGFYANTRCKNTGVTASLVSTVHGITLPAAYSYSSIQVAAYGGAARKKPASKAILRYLTVGGDWRLERVMARTLGTHAGAVTTATTSFINPDHTFYWGFYTGAGNRYDVKTFTVKVVYKVVA